MDAHKEVFYCIMPSCGYVIYSGDIHDISLQGSSLYVGGAMYSTVKYLASVCCSLCTRCCAAAVRESRRGERGCDTTLWGLHWAKMSLKSFHSSVELSLIDGWIIQSADFPKSFRDDVPDGSVEQTIWCVRLLRGGRYCWLWSFQRTFCWHVFQSLV